MNRNLNTCVIAGRCCFACSEPDALAEGENLESIPETMRILVHDYAGHAFALSLSRELAKRGYDLEHLYCRSVLAPRGSLECTGKQGVPTIAPIGTRRPIARTRLLRRWMQEREYTRNLLREVERIRPDVILSGNAPLDCQHGLQRWAKRNSCRFVFWAQDLIGVAAQKILSDKFGFSGALVGRAWERFEARIMLASDAVVVISEDFVDVLHQWGVGAERITVIRNWAPIDEIPVRPKVNAWAEAHGLSNRKVVMYTGTLGMKHNPGVLVDVANGVRGDGALVVVVSEGPTVEHLSRQVEAQGVDNLLVLPFQSPAAYPDVLGAADVLLGLLTADAGVFSVPSKILAGMCAGRAQVLSVPPTNLAARLLEEAGAGVVVEPSNTGGYVWTVARLLQDAKGRENYGSAGRQYAEAVFNTQEIADKFEKVLREGVRDGSDSSLPQ